MNNLRFFFMKSDFLTIPILGVLITKVQLLKNFPHHDSGTN